MSAAQKRDNLGRLLPGVSGNPSGRPKGYKGLAALILKETNNGQELFDFAIKVFRNGDRTYKHSDRVEMLKILLDRGFGKPTTTVIELGADDIPETHFLDDISTEGLEEIEATITKHLKSV